MAEPLLPSSGYRDYEDPDPQYLDEEPEIVNDELPRQDHAALPRSRHVRLPRPMRRFEED